jgi:F-type H+-transporting ATPase subunit a
MILATKTYFKHILTAAFIAVFALVSAPLAAEESEHNETVKEEKFDAGKMIMEHILDAHDWHLFGEHHTAVSIPLPVILYTDKGLDVFMSGAFHHGEEIVHGKYNYKLAERNIEIVDADGKVNHEATEKLKDFSITKNVVALFISIVLLLFIFIPIANKYKANANTAPSGLQSLLEPIILFIQDNVAIPNIGKKKYEKYMPFLLTVFFFILINNLLGLIPFFPGGANLTGNISVTLTLAAIVLIIVIVTSNKHYWQHILAMPGVPKPVLIILTPIEILGFVIRPFVLMMRLFANITAGHIVILSFISLIFIFGAMSAAAGYGISVFSMLLVVFMSLLELLVAFLQAYVFTLLSAIYFGSAIEEGHHEGEHH